MAHAIQIDRQRGPRPGHKVEDVDRIGQGAIAVEDVERIEVLSKETLGVCPVEWPGKGAVSFLQNQKNKSQEHHARSPCGRQCLSSQICASKVASVSCPPCVSHAVAAWKALEEAASNGAHWG